MLIIGAGITPILGPFVAEKLAIPVATVFTVRLVFAGVIEGARVVVARKAAWLDVCRRPQPALDLGWAWGSAARS